MPGVAWKLWPLARLQDPRSAFGWGPLCNQGATFFACCSHGNTPPVASCDCGLHYVVDVAAFFGSSTVRDSYRQLGERVVASVGEPIGQSLPDRNVLGGWGGEHPSRAAGFTIRGLIVSEEVLRLRHVVRGLQQKYSVPVVVARWDDPRAGTELLTAIDGARGQWQ